MIIPVDLTNLRNMTDGDKNLEKVLFDEFITSFEKGIEVLRRSLEPSASIWRSQSHSLKGIALNLGAAPLSDLCKRAQEAGQAAPFAKQELLQKIEAEYAKVKEFLLKAAA